MFGISAALALVTAAMAVFTYIMAVRTRELGKDTVDASRRAERHHQQSLWPIVVAFTPPDIAVTPNRRHAQFTIKNIGLGTCANCKIKLLYIDDDAVTP